jgi:hypothetical protein
MHGVVVAGAADDDDEYADDDDDRVQKLWKRHTQIENVSVD